MPNEIVHVPARSGQAYWLRESIFNFLVTGEQSGGSYSTMEILVNPNEGPGPHVHDESEEQFYVLDGELTYQVGDQTFQVSTGDFIHIPRGTVHSFTNGNTPSKLLATFSPAEAGKAFEESGEPMDDRTAWPPPATTDAIKR